MNGKQVRKTICLVLSLVLLIATFVFLPSSIISFGGAGDGNSAEIATIEDFAVLLKDFSSELTGYDSSYYSKTVPDDYAPTADIRAAASRVHTSVTVEESSSAYMDMYVKQTVISGETTAFAETSSNVSMDRGMKVYITPDAVLYECDIDLSTSNTQSTSESELQVYKRNISMKMLLYIEEGRILLRFERFDFIVDHVAEADLSKVLHKWIDLTSEDFNSGWTDGLLEVNDANFAVLALMGTVIDSHLSDGFERNGKSYGLKGEYFNSFCQAVLEKQQVETEYFANPYQGAFNIDLYDKKVPRMQLTIENEVKNYSNVDNFVYGERNVHADITYVENDDFTFSNIDNTAIRSLKNEKTIGFDELKSLLEDKS